VMKFTRSFLCPFLASKSVISDSLTPSIRSTARFKPPATPATAPISSPLALDPRARMRHMLLISGNHHRENFASWKKDWKSVTASFRLWQANRCPAYRKNLSGKPMGCTKNSFGIVIRGEMFIGAVGTNPACFWRTARR